MRTLVFCVALLMGRWSVARIEGAPATVQPDALLSTARCEAAVRRQLADWNAHFPRTLVDPAGPTGLRSLRVPTDAMGVWLRVTEEARGEVAIERVTAVRVERLRFDEACAASESAVATPPARPGALTDAELVARIGRGERGVFLLWSPHMPLSVDQHAVLAEVARDLGLAVVPLLDPAADSDYAARVARERGWNAEVTRPLGGIELAFRGMTTHTPSLQLFAAGKLVGPVLYGYRAAAALRAALEDTLAGR